MPRVPASGRSYLEETARRNGLAGFTFTERTAAGELIPAADRPEYYPVYFVEPLKGNERALGFDLGSNPVRLTGLAAARDSGRLVASARVKLVQETGGQFAVLLLAPVYHFPIGAPSTQSFAARRDYLGGWAVGVLRVANTAKSALGGGAGAGSGLMIKIADLSAPRDEQLLYASAGTNSEFRPDSALRIERTLTVGGRRWSIVAEAKAAAFLDGFPWIPTAAALGILVITALLARHLRSLALRARIVQHTVEQRTQQLREANLQLRAEAAERQRAEESVRDREARTRAIVENALDGILTIDQDGLIESFNPAASSMFGYRPEDVIGKSLTMLLPEPYRDLDAATIGDVLRTVDFDRIGIGPDSTGLRSDGLPFPMELRLSPMAVGGKLMFTGVVRDITEHKKVELMKTEFVSTVSHELRTPLTAIHGSLGLLRGGIGGELPAKARSMIDIGYDNCGRLVRLINDILDIEKIESGKIAYKVVPLDVASFLQQAIDANQSYAEGFGVKLVLREGSGDARINGDRDRLLQVMTNLLGNAAKWSPAGSQVVVTAQRIGDSVRIAVADSGPGIANEFRNRIFSKFAQADSSDTRDKGGTGLGLNISKAIVDGHGGSIGFETEAGKGTTFYFDLPAATGRQSGTAAANPHAPRILICEDDADIAAVLQAAIAAGGCAVDIARTATEAKTLLAKHTYSAMTLDIGLPDQDGLSLVRELRSQDATRQLPIVVVSAREAPRADEGSLRAFHISDWLCKPVEPERLTRSIEQARRGSPVGKSRILHIEDDPGVAEVIAAQMSSLADMTTVASVARAQQRLADERFDLILLDLSLPDGRGEELLSCLPGSPNAATPVIIFSAEEVPRDIAQRAHAALVKSRISDDGLRAVISTCLLLPPARAA